MSDPNTRHPLAPSLSFSGSSSPAISKPLKRRLTTNDMNFFTPAATSFKPRPYAPNGTNGLQYKGPQASSNNNRSAESLAIPIPIMDPTPDDPSAIFIHPPFAYFPDADQTPDGLSYALMAANPNWFLDPYDFKSANSTNPDAIAYPPHLEPPRGWCPAKKRDLKNRGTDGWPGGEEPRLRCTFCRRTYAGVNAKSMWRRHVFEKHKIAMANRRDGNDRPRGRGSNKENKQSRQAAETQQNGAIGLNFTLQYAREDTVLKPEVHSTLSLNDQSVENGETGYPSFADDATYTSRILDLKLSSPPPFPVTASALSSTSPPFTPRLLHNSDGSDTQSALTSPIVPLRINPPSPYNPLLTPSFRHSPPSLPSDQPWKFPSPSHPLHSRVHEMCLTMLAPTTASPNTNGIPLLETSSGDKQLDSDATKISGPSLQMSPSNLRMSAGRRSAQEKNVCQTNYSPFGRNSYTTGVDRQKRLMSPSKPLDTWITDNGIFTVDLGATRVSQDPFEDLYNHWLDIKNYTNSHTFSTLGVESPVLRSSHLPSNEFGMIGMDTAPSFTFQGSPNDDGGYFSTLADDESEEVSVAPWSSYLCIDNDESAQGREIVHRPQKRRRTID